MPSWKPFGGALSKRPHIGSKQLKYQYDVTVHSLELESPALPTGTISVLWTRGSKSAITGEQTLEGNVATFGENRFMLNSTLYFTASGVKFAPKLCSFALIEQESHGARVLAKCKADLSPLVEVRVTHVHLSPIAL